MKKQTIQMLDLVIVGRAIPEKRVRKWAIGTVVELLNDEVFLVEFSDKNGREYAMLALPVADLMKVEHEPAAVLT